MRRPNRDYNIFNISMLDTISGALGAVMVIMIVLLTQKIGLESMSCQDIKEELISTSNQLNETTEELRQTRKELSKKTTEQTSIIDKVFSITKIVDNTVVKLKETINKIYEVNKELFEKSPEKGMSFQIPKKIVMLIDLSGSMSPENNKYKEDRLSQLKAAIKMFIAGMDQEYYIDIVYFPAFPENIDKKLYPNFIIKPELDNKCKNFEMRDDAYDNAALICYKYGYFEGELKQIFSEEDKLNFYNKIACLKAYHDTPTETALDFVLTDGRYKDAEGIILFSDGQPDSIRKKKTTTDALLKLIKNKNKSNKKIFTVGVGTEFRNKEDTLAVDFCKRLASQNEGFYIGF
ncbi:MAG: VWA domain-containing protein [Spirochaetes bacterium]|nr:VWA domain-containing protein [Spirochaetota bacterium]